MRAAEEEKMKLKREFEKQKAEMEQTMAEQLTKTREEAAKMSRRQMEEMSKQHNESLKKQQEEQAKRMSETLQLQEKMRKSPRPRVPESDKDVLIERLQRREQRLMAEVDKLEKELKRMNKLWEMKVIILQQSMNAIRNESFLRAGLHRQAARLQQASVVYASDGPMILPERQWNVKKETLPEI